MEPVHILAHRPGQTEREGVVGRGMGDRREGGERKGGREGRQLHLAPLILISTSIFINFMFHCQAGGAGGPGWPRWNGFCHQISSVAKLGVRIPRLLPAGS